MVKCIRGERALILAMLERAAADLTSAVREDRVAAKAWVCHWSSDDIEIPFTFPWCCEALDLEPHHVMRAIKKWAPQHVRTIMRFTRYVELILEDNEQEAKLPKSKNDR